MTDDQEPLAAVSPQTQALSLYIQNAVQGLRNRSPQSTDRHSEDQQSSLIFFGNWQDPYPRLLVTDPILEPVDKVVWQIIRTHITTPGSVTAFPSYSAIRTGANIKSNHTVSRAITILRATRWLSLCERVRDTQGRFLGNIYALHDEPVTLGDAMYLDSDYIEFLRDSQNHKHLRVGRIAQSVLATIQDMIDSGKNAMGERVQTWTYERRLGLLDRERKDAPALQLTENNHFYALSDRHITALREQNPDTHDAQPNMHMGDETQYTQVQKMHTVENDANTRVHKVHPDENIALPPGQNTHTDICSSSNNINITTTNKHQSRACAKPSESLHFPPRISANERNLAMMYLNSIDDSQRQDVLDEWHGRLNTGNKRGNPIDNPIGYLAVLCQRAKSGAFQLTIGLRIREAREREHNHKRKMEELDKRHEEKALEMLQKHAGNGASQITKQLEAIRSRYKKNSSRTDE